MAVPTRSAGAQRGSGGSMRAEPITATVSGSAVAGSAVSGSAGNGSASRGPVVGACVLPCSAGDELIATHPLLLRQGDDGAAQDALRILAARVDREGAADPGLAARFVDVP